MAPSRIRSVDTNPTMWPSHLIDDHQITPALHFAKCATVVMELYSEQLQAGEPIPAKAWWVRLVPTDGMQEAHFNGVPASEGLDEVHEVPYDPSVLALPDQQRRRAVLNWLQQHMLALADSLGWPTEPLVQAYHGCLNQDLRLVRASRTKSSPGRTHRTWATFEIDGNGNGWTSLHIEGAGVSLANGPADALPSLTAAARTWRTLRWDNHTTAGIEPWLPGQPAPSGVTHGPGQRLTLSVLG